MKHGHYALDMYRLCPKKFRFRFIDRISPPSSPDLVMGKHVHTALKMFFRLPPKDRAQKRLTDELRNAWRTDRSVFAGKTELEKEYGERAIRMLENFLRNYDLNPQPILLEDFVEFPLAGHIIWGRVDRVDPLEDGGLRVIDYKTGRVPSDENFWLAKDLSATVYSLGVGARFRDRKIRDVEFIFLSEARSLVLASQEPRLKSKLAEIESIIMRIAADKDWKPRPGGYCSWCDYLDKCPEGRAHMDSLKTHEIEIVDEDLPF